MLCTYTYISLNLNYLHIKTIRLNQIIIYNRCIYITLYHCLNRYYTIPKLLETHLCLLDYVFCAFEEV